MKKVKMILILLIISFILTSCSSEAGKIVDGYTQVGNLKLEQVQMPKKGEEIAVINTNKGEFKMRLFPEVAPKAVENFKALVEEGFYNGLKFSRVEENFLIQVGDNPEYPDGKIIFEEPFEDEVDLNYRHITGCVGLGKKANENTSYFYIIVQDGIDEEYLEVMKELGEEGYPKEVVKAYEVLGGVPRLDMRYTIFGQIFYGMDTVKRINQLPVNPLTKEPVEDVVIDRIEIVAFEGK